MPALAKLIARALSDKEPPEAVARDVSQFRRRFDRLHFVR
jgi:glycine hydroxymethyltransferase